MTKLSEDTLRPLWAQTVIVEVKTGCGDDNLPLIEGKHLRVLMLDTRTKVWVGNLAVQAGLNS